MNSCTIGVDKFNNLCKLQCISNSVNLYSFAMQQYFISIFIHEECLQSFFYLIIIIITNCSIDLYELPKYCHMPYVLSMSYDYYEFYEVFD